MRNTAYGSGIVALAGLCVALAATFAAPTVVHSPIRPEGNWRWVFVAAVALSFAAFLAGLWALRARETRLGPVLALAAAIQLAPLATPLLLSTDVYGYWESGWIAAVADVSPYDHPPAEFKENPANRHRGAAWDDYPTWYGPLFIAATELQAVLVDWRAGVVRLYKLIAAFAMLGVVALTAVCARRRAYAAAFVGWNPLLALHFAGGGHNDIWMILLFLGALALWRRGRRDAAAVLWVAAIAIKWVPAMWVPLDGLANRTRRPPLPWVGLALGGALVAGLATWRFGTSWLGSFLPIQDQLGLISSTSIPFHIGTLLDVPAVWVGRGLFLVFVAAYALLLIAAWRGRSRRALSTALLLLAVTWLGPWYVIWCVPLAAIEEDGPAEALSLGLSAFLLRDALPIPWIF